VACEPALSSYSVRPWVSFTHIILPHGFFSSSLVQFATDFYKALVNITSGIMLPLTTADLLAHAIVGLVLENLDMERLVREVGQAVAQRILGNNESVDDVARELHEKLLLRNESTKKVVIESIYRDSDEARHNVEIFSLASNLAEARPHLRRVRSLQGNKLNIIFIQFCRLTGPPSRTSTCKCGCLARGVHMATYRPFRRAHQIRDRPSRPASRRRRHPARSSRTLRRSAQQRRPASTVQPSNRPRSHWQATRRRLGVYGRPPRPAHTTTTMRRRSRPTEDKRFS
jgi:hypothetical protein